MKNLYKKKGLLFLILMSFFSMWFNSTLPLHPDEAYYWVWSKHLQMSYFDHPPFVAYLIKIFTLFSNSIFFIRLASVVFVLCTGILIYYFAIKLFSIKTANISMVLFVLCPLIQGASIVISPDVPLMFFWILTIIFLYKYIFENKEIYIYYVGLTLGLALLSKYTAVLLIPIIIIELFYFRSKKKLKLFTIFKTFLLSIVVFSPVLIWNAKNNWVSFLFQWKHGTTIQNTHFNIIILFQNLLKYIVDQFLCFNPIFFILLFYAIYWILKNKKSASHCIKNKKQKNTNFEKNFFLFIPFIFTFIFFLVTSLKHPAEPNWCAPAYLSITILLANMISNLKDTKKIINTLYIIGISLSVIAILVIKFPGYTPINKYVKSKFWGYDKIFKEASEVIPNNNVVFTNTYQDASEAIYYMDKQKKIYTINGRYSQYNLWENKIRNILKEKNQVFYVISRSGNSQYLKKYFKKIKMIKKLEYKDNIVDRTYWIFGCGN